MINYAMPIVLLHTMISMCLYRSIHINNQNGCKGLCEFINLSMFALRGMYNNSLSIYISDTVTLK